MYLLGKGRLGRLHRRESEAILTMSSVNIRQYKGQYKKRGCVTASESKLIPQHASENCISTRVNPVNFVNISSLSDQHSAKHIRHGDQWRGP